MAKDGKVTVTDEAGAPVEVQELERPVDQSGAIDKNPLKEQTIRVRVRPGIEFYHMGDLVKDGDEIDMAISQARAAAHLVMQVADDGELKSVPPQAPQAGSVPRANLSGLARHERIEALQKEEAELSKRLDAVRAQREHEDNAVEINSVGPASPSKAYPPGTTGAPGNTAVPPREQEPRAGHANSGPLAQKK